MILEYFNCSERVININIVAFIAMVIQIKPSIKPTHSKKPSVFNYYIADSALLGHIGHVLFRPNLSGFVAQTSGEHLRLFRQSK